MHACAVISTKTCPSLTGQNHHHHHHHQSVSVKCSLLLLPLWTSSGQPMAERDCSGVGSARRRRERRLRSWWRHERMTVAAELAVALHHSRGVGPTVPHEAQRGQTPASSGGRRPGVLKEPEPPVVVEHAACPCSGAPLLVVPSLAAAESACVDGTSLKYLLKLALKEREEEVERMRREEEEAARSELVSLIRVPQEHRTADQVRRITAASRILSTAQKRKRKKRRKKKTPKSSSFRSSSGVRPWRCGQGSRSRSSSSGGCGRLREHVRLVPAVADLQWKVPPSISSTKWWTFQLCYGDRYG